MIDFKLKKVSESLQFVVESFNRLIMITERVESLNQTEKNRVRYRRSPKVRNSKSRKRRKSEGGREEND